ncbi:ATP-dependent DNA helicase PIF1-like protein [Tanacetum coccineum]
MVTLWDSDHLPALLQREGIDVTMFTDWFELNKRDPAARTLTYAEIPKHYVWHEKLKLWKQRKEQKCIGRIVYSSLASGERYYLRMLLNVVRGPKEFAELMTLLDIRPTTAQPVRDYSDFLRRKTFLYKTIMERLQSKRMIVLAVASSGITSLLLPGGRTAHSRFVIPLELMENNTCRIKQNTHLVELMQQVQLVIWDEAPMTQKYAFEALDKTLRDILGYKNPQKRNQLFGGLTVLLGGDFRQILPVIPKGKRADIVQSCINRSQLWKYCKVFTLTRSMRVNEYYDNDEINTRKQDFNKWVLAVGDGTVLAKKNKEKMRQLGLRFQRERAILTPKNDDADVINAYMFTKLADDTVTYNSADEICKASTDTLEQHNLYPVEFLNNLNFPGIPPHSLCLKKELPIMLIRNVNPSKGLCNGTRLIITELG